VGLVDHEEGPVAFLHLDETGKVWEISVHAVETLDNDADSFVLMAGALENAVQGLPIIVGKGKTLCTGEARTFHGAIVDEGIMNDEIAGTEQVAERCDSRGVSADHGQAVISSVKRGKLLFEIAMDLPLPGYDAAG
jgi:hypothetical protein